MADSAVDFAALENEPVATPGEQTPEAPSEPGTETQQPTETPGTETQSAEPLTGKAVRDAVRAAAEAFPEQAKLFKQLAASHFRVETAYKSAFPTPEEALSAKQLIEGVGGIDGISQLQERIQGYDQQETGLESGDPAVLDSFFEDYPEGAANLAPHYLERLGRTNPDALTAAVAPYAMGLLQNAGVDGHLATLLQETDPARLKAGIEQLANWYLSQSRNISQLRTQSTKPAGADKLQQERFALANEKEDLFRGGVTERVNAQAIPALTIEVDKYARQYKLNDTQKDHFRATLTQKIVAEMNADETYKKQTDLRYANKTRSQDKIADFVAGEFNRRVREKAFDVVKSIYGAPKSAQPSGTGQVKATQPLSAPGGGPLRISYVPTNDQLDTSRKDFDILRIQGRGYLKGSGRFVDWSAARNIA